MQDKSEQEQAWDFAQEVLQVTYPSAKLKGLVREGQPHTLNTSPIHQYVFQADFGDGHTSEVTTQRGPAGNWQVYVPNPPDSGMPRTLP